MRNMFLALAMVFMGASFAQAETVEVAPMAVIEDAAELEALAWWQNPPGSRWITLACNGRRVAKTCYAPEGYKIRHYRDEELRGRNCRKHRDFYWNQDKVSVGRGCSVRGRAFIIPAQYCRDAGKYRFCR